MRRYSTPAHERLPPLAATAGPATTAASLSWTELGPGNIGGRTRALVIDPTATDTMYAGAADGGVWKTVDSGAHWAPLNDLLPNLSVNVLVIDPNDHNTLYAGTGEGYFNIDAVRGGGIFKTTNGGTDWTTIGGTGSSSDFYYVNDIVVSKGNSQHVYAATRAGVFRSLDGGGSWTKVVTAPANGDVGCTDLAIRTDVLAADTVFAACGSFVSGTVYRNTDAAGSGTWDSVLTEAGMGRTSLAIAPSDQNYVYALSDEAGTSATASGLHAVFRSTTGGGSGTWSARVTSASTTKLNTVLLSNPLYALLTECSLGTSQRLNQGWYDNVIAVDPTNRETVWVGGIDLFRSDDGGANWGEASRWFTGGIWTQFAHADQHAIVFSPGYNGTTNKTMFVGNDGGLYRTTNALAATATGNTAPCSTSGGFTWSPLNNGYAVTQFYDGVPYPSGTTYFGGTQDNGTVRGTDAAGANAWSTILGGDGGSVAVDPGDTSILYAENYGLSIQKSTNGGNSFSDATSGISDPGFLFIAPFVMDPSSGLRLWTGGWYIWRTTNGAGSWQRASAITPGIGSVSAQAVAPSDGSGNHVLVGMSDGYILRNGAALSATSTTSWDNVQPRSGYVDGLAYDPTDPNVAYAVYSTFGGTHVWKSIDGGASWTGIDGTGLGALPDIPVHSIVIDPTATSHLYIGTDLGVYVSLDGGATWSVENGAFANVDTEKLRLNASTLFAFTHGRGAFRVSLGAPPPPPPPPFVAPKCVVPKVIGQLLPRAKTRIRNAHCRVGAITYAVSTARKKNRVLSQTPASGRRLKNGARVSVRVGRGPRH